MEHLLAPLPARGRTCGEDIEHNRVKIVYTKENHRKYGGFCSFGGEGGIRTLDELLTHTRVPVVRHKPG